MSSTTDHLSKSPNDHNPTTADEVTPLLATSNSLVGAGTEQEPALLNGKPSNGSANVANNHDSNDETEVDVPLPKLQILVLCYARLVEPIAFFSIFPFINQMVQETGNLKESDVGFYSGLVVSSEASCFVVTHRSGMLC